MNFRRASPAAGASEGSSMQVTVTEPDAVNLTAFPIKFIKTEVDEVISAPVTLLVS